MKYIAIILLFIPIVVNSQEEIYNYLDYDIFYFESLDKPKFDSIPSRTIRTVTIIENNDTISKYVDLEIINQKDKRIIRDYSDDGTVEETTVLISIPPNMVIWITEFIDIESFERDTSFWFYNENDQIISKQSKYTFYNAKYYYNDNFKLTKREIKDNEGRVVRSDTFMYNIKGLLTKTIRNDSLGKMISYIKYLRNKWVNYRLYQVLTFNSDSFLTERILPPTNPAIDSNNCIIKRYSKPFERNFPVVETREYELKRNKGLIQIHNKHYRDQKYIGEMISYYDDKNRIIKKTTRKMEDKGFEWIVLYKYETQLE